MFEFNDQDLTTEAVFYRMKDLERILGVADSTIYGWIEKGQFPKQVKFGGTARWVARELNEWMNERVSDRDNAEKHKLSANSPSVTE